MRRRILPDPVVAVALTEMPAQNMSQNSRTKPQGKSDHRL
jgi:hypothetical protein